MLSMNPEQRALVLACSMAMFAIDLDFFAVQAALPATALDFATTTTALQWVISGYMLALASGLIVGGRLADLLGRRTWFFIGAAVFGLASPVGGLALAPGVLIAVLFVLIVTLLGRRGAQASETTSSVRRRLECVATQTPPQTPPCGCVGSIQSTVSGFSIGSMSILTATA